MGPYLPPCAKAAFSTAEELSKESTKSTPIHQSAWKLTSANFAITEFSEVAREGAAPKLTPTNSKNWLVGHPTEERQP